MSKTEIIQNYVADNKEKCSFNDFIRPECYKIEICLNQLVSRKNMSFKRLVRKLNNIFLLEYLCVVLQDEALWLRKQCKSGPKFNCGIQTVIDFINIIK